MVDPANVTEEDATSQFLAPRDKVGSQFFKMENQFYLMENQFYSMENRFN